MMDLPSLISFTVFASVAAFTPGPNNIMLTAAGANFGFQRTLPHIFGITFGFCALLLAAGFGLAGLFAAVPQLYEVMRYLSIAYLFFLAWKIGTAGRSSHDVSATPITFLQAAAFQIINPKAVSVIISATTAYVSGANSMATEIIILVLVFFVVTLPATLAWAVFGTVIATFLKTERFRKTFNAVMALLLICSLLPTLLKH